MGVCWKPGTVLGAAKGCEPNSCLRGWLAGGQSPVPLQDPSLAQSSTVQMNLRALVTNPEVTSLCADLGRWWNVETGDMAWWKDGPDTSSVLLGFPARGNLIVHMV